jgi:hypothetical protein
MSAVVVIAVAPFSAAQHTIPLSSIISTNPQKGMRQLIDAFPAGDGKEYEKKFADFTSNASNAFLVDARNDRAAITGSVRIWFGPMSPATVSSRGNHWLAVFLGLGPSHPRWFEVTKVVVASDKVRLSYRTPQPSEITRDVRQYFFWVPLGKLQSGVNSIELYDENLKATVLSRRVNVLPDEADAKKENLR